MYTMGKNDASTSRMINEVQISTGDMSVTGDESSPLNWCFKGPSSMSWYSLGIMSMPAQCWLSAGWYTDKHYSRSNVILSNLKLPVSFSWEISLKEWYHFVYSPRFVTRSSLICHSSDTTCIELHFWSIKFILKPNIGWLENNQNRRGWA